MHKAGWLTRAAYQCRHFPILDMPPLPDQKQKPAIRPSAMRRKVAGIINALMNELGAMIDSRIM
jgi:hypothetical protein